jgi:hypothetical protein
MWTDAGKVWSLKVMTGQIAQETINMGVYTNTPTWSNATVIGNLTEPSGGSGYARQATAGWATPTLTGGDDGSTVATPVTFSNTSGSPIVAVGFFYLAATTAVLLGGDNFTSPLTIPATVGTLTVTPQFLDNTY